MLEQLQESFLRTRYQGEAVCIGPPFTDQGYRKSLTRARLRDSLIYRNVSHWRTDQWQAIENEGWRNGPTIQLLDEGPQHLAVVFG